MVKLGYMKKIFGILMAVVVGGSALVATPVMAANSKGGGCGEVVPFFGFYPWYYGLTAESTNGEGCTIATPHDDGSGVGLSQFIWTIVLNVVADLMLAVGYIAVGVTIWGGFYMITSNGDPGKVVKARKILVAGVAGALIAIFASVIAHALIDLLLQT